ncbi:MAG: phenylacetate--CoA ligase family protein [Gammaproteobacteria bacterium]|nr:phenylacetate--CoA ligase family protein [Gammaproteobacteria bacterium]
MSESIGPALRDICLEVWNAPVVDIYSARETGYLALQCPEHQHYHVQSENVFVEILNDEGNPCNPGEVGRVIVTTLHNYASPLIRYDIGDYAEVGRPCDCGRGLPVLNRIAGRVRNMLTLPTGEKFWPLFLSMHSASDAPITQLQIVQRTLNKLEVRVVVDRSLFDQERVELTRALHDSLHYPFELEFVECQQIERSKSGKYEEFYSEL